MDLKFESHFILSGENQLHLRRIYSDKSHSSVLCFHGVIENGRVFYTESGKGLAPHLARAGYDVFVADFRGQGESRPQIDARSSFGQMEIIREDFEKYFEAVRSITRRSKFSVICHSWGGVLLFAYFARFAKGEQSVDSVVLLGTKRSVRVRNLRILWSIVFLWNRLAVWISALSGYLPAVQLGFGSDNEARLSLLDCVKWALPSEWIDLRDGFHYGKAIKKISIPPTLSLAAVADTHLGNPSDVRDFSNEIGASPENVRILGKAFGNLHNYGHINLLTHQDAPSDVFPVIEKWLRTRVKSLSGN